MRLFVAIDLHKLERQRLAELPMRQQWAGRDQADLNWVRPENLHITLKFLGGVPDEQVPAICHALGELPVSGPLKISVGSPAFLPPRGPLRVFVAEVGGDLDVLAALQADIERALEPLGFRASGAASRRTSRSPARVASRGCRPVFARTSRNTPGRPAAASRSTHSC